MSYIRGAERETALLQFEVNICIKINNKLCISGLIIKCQFQHKAESLGLIIITYYFARVNYNNKLEKIFP